MQGLQDRQHPRYIPIRKVVLARLLQSIIPDLVPQNCSPDELGTDQLGLVDNVGRMVPHLGGDTLRDRFPARYIGLGGDSQGIDEGLWVGTTDVV